MEKRHENLSPKRILEQKINSWVARIRTSILPEEFKERAETIIENILKNSGEDIPEHKEMLASFELLGALMVRLEKPEEIENFEKILEIIEKDIISLRHRDN